MIARTVRVVYVDASQVESEDGYTVPTGRGVSPTKWRIVSSERMKTIGSERPYYRVTLVTS
jgi:hypothetical protein